MIQEIIGIAGVGFIAASWIPQLIYTIRTKKSGLNLKFGLARDTATLSALHTPPFKLGFVQFMYAHAPEFDTFLPSIALCSHYVHMYSGSSLSIPPNLT